MKRLPLLASLFTLLPMATAAAQAGDAASPEARVTFLRGDVELHGNEHRPAKVGDVLHPTHRLKTGAAGSADVTLFDGTQLRLGAATQVVFFGSAKSKPKKTPAAATARAPKGGKTGKASARKGRGAKPADTTLVRGALRVVLAENPGGVRIATNAGAVVVEGQGRIEAAPRMTRVLAYSGRAKLGSGKKSVEVAAGSGVDFEPRGKPRSPEALPAAPSWLVAPAPLTLTTDPTGDVAGKLAPAAAAATAAAGPTGPEVARWHVEIARDDRFADLILDTHMAKDATTVLAEKLPPGRYFARISGVDGRGREGAPGATAPSAIASARLARANPMDRPVIELTPPGFLCSIDGAPPAELQAGVEVDPTRDHKLACQASSAAPQVELTFAALDKPAPPPLAPPALRPAPASPEPLLPLAIDVAKPAVPAPAPGPRSGSRIELGVSAGAGADTGGRTTLGPSVAIEVARSQGLGSGALAIGIRAGYERYSFPRVEPEDVDLLKDVGTLSLAVEYRFLPPAAAFSPFVRLFPQVILEHERFSPSIGTSSIRDTRAAVGIAVGARLAAGPGDLRIEVGARQALDDPFETGAPDLGWLLGSIGYALTL